MWDERYASAEYVYGTEPNAFLAEQAHRLSGPVLSLAEGEGRNAVFLAGHGLTVHGVDSSAVGLRKAHALARSRNVDIFTEVADLAHFSPKPSHYGAVVSIFAHLPGRVRQHLYPLIEESLLPGGLLVLEAYSENQLGRGTGGPKEADMLMSAAKIEQGFAQLEVILLHEIERDVSEGLLHTGIASVVPFIGRKKA